MPWGLHCFWLYVGKILNCEKNSLKSISSQEQAIAKGMKPSQASFLLSSAGVGSLIGRISMGFVCDKVTNNFGKEKIVYTIIVGNIINGSGNF